MKPSLLSVAIYSALFSSVALAEVTPEDLPSMLVSADFRPAEAHSGQLDHF